VNNQTLFFHHFKTPYQSKAVFRRRLPIWFDFAIGLLLTLAWPAASGQAAAFRAAELSGYLAGAKSEHLFTLEPQQDNSLITLDLTVEPKDTPGVAESVNFWIFSEERWHQVQAGTPYYSASVAAGNRIWLDGQETLRAEFNVVNARPFMVVVYSDATAPVAYQLRANNAILVDTFAQAGASASQRPAVRQAEQPSNAAQTSGAASAKTNAKTKGKSKEANKQRLSANLASLVLSPGESKMMIIFPSKKNVNVAITMSYTPPYATGMASNVVFFMFDEDRLHQLQAGAVPDIINLGAGAPIDGVDGQLKARVRAVGVEPLTLLVVNRSQVQITYSLQISGGKVQLPV
jgi:hypothetical protein